MYFRRSKEKYSIFIYIRDETVYIKVPNKSKTIYQLIPIKELRGGMDRMLAITLFNGCTITMQQTSVEVGFSNYWPIPFITRRSRTKWATKRAPVSSDFNVISILELFGDNIFETNTISFVYRFRIHCLFLERYYGLSRNTETNCAPLND